MSAPSSTMRPVIALQDQTEFVDAFARLVADSLGTVCAACGLERMGHAVETSWLGNAPHGYSARAASRDDVERARALTVDVDSERWHHAPRPAIPELVEPLHEPVAARSVVDAIRDILDPRNTLGAPRRVQP